MPAVAASLALAKRGQGRMHGRDGRLGLSNVSVGSYFWQAGGCFGWWRPVRGVGAGGRFLDGACAGPAAEPPSSSELRAARHGPCPCLFVRSQPGWPGVEAGADEQRPRPESRRQKGRGQRAEQRRRRGRGCSAWARASGLRINSPTGLRCRRACCAAPPMRPGGEGVSSVASPGRAARGASRTAATRHAPVDGPSPGPLRGQ